MAGGKLEVRLLRREILCGFNGKSFKRFFIDDVLDERYTSFNKDCPNILHKKLVLNEQKQSSYQEFKSLEE